MLANYAEERGYDVQHADTFLYNGSLPETSRKEIDHLINESDPFVIAVAHEPAMTDETSLQWLTHVMNDRIEAGRVVVFENRRIVSRPDQFRVLERTMDGATGEDFRYAWGASKGKMSEIAWGTNSTGVHEAIETLVSSNNPKEDSAWRAILRNPCRRASR